MPSPAATTTSPFLTSLTSLIGLQLTSRVLTFTLNQALFRLASPRAYGVAAIQLESLMLGTILFLSREGVRGALLRIGSTIGKDGKAKGKEGEEKEKIGRGEGVGFVPILIGIPLSICTAALYATYATSETRMQPYFHQAVVVYALSAVVELLAEPMHNMAMTELKTHVRVRAEGIGITMKAIVTFLILFCDQGGDLALLAFAFGQLAYGTTVLLLYLFSYGIPKMTKTFDREILALSLTMTSQSVVKHFLTEGDKFILSWFSPLEDQGGYAVAVNYGSLIARVVFQPIEETLRLYFSRSLPSKRHEASRTLIALLNIQISCGLLILAFGSQYISLVLQVFLPPMYLSTSAPRILSAWVWYIPVLAINGGLEAFLSSAADKHQLNKQSRWMIMFSIVYISSAITLYKQGFGDVSLVYANIINLSARITYVFIFARSYFPDASWKDMLPPASMAVALLVSADVVRISEIRLQSLDIVKIKGRMGVFSGPVVTHVGLGGGLALICVGLWFRGSRELIAVFRRGKMKTK
ncbi:oligosaccharide translocation protein rft1 [Moniliophthora roreri MCA 2997]|uniref:Man(5)GlcNAc(2)-PP-dolichol translocation protein RFT1 n=1 Tax=Moniliophthora roreri (strain MCA 2997) TaxID=1381753 RepID=V2WXG3_MONRO|nr:oligosaccharide translocation protein rft1 [Moniliophthora roreri MCA 2997]